MRRGTNTKRATEPGVRSPRPAIVVLVCLLPILTLVSGEIPNLRYWDHDPLEDPLLTLLLTSIPVSSEQPDLVVKPPNALKPPVRYAVILNAATPFVIAVGAGARPQIVVDSDGDGDLAEDSPISSDKGRSSAGPHLFGPIGLQNAEGRPQAKVRVLAAGTSLFIFPAGYWSGRAMLAGKRRRVALVDMDFDGRIQVNPPWSRGRAGRAPDRPADILAVDFDGDGRWSASARDTAPEIQPLAKMVLCDRNFYAVSVTPDISTIDFTWTAPPMGTISLGDTQADLHLEGDTVSLQVTTDKNGLIQLPGGRYRCTAVQLNQGKWSITGRPDTGALLDLHVEAGATLPIALGGRLLAKADVTPPENGRISIGAQLVGQAGERYSPGATKKGRRQSAPKFKILSDEGGELASGQFEYG